MNLSFSSEKRRSPKTWEQALRGILNRMTSANFEKMERQVIALYESQTGINDLGACAIIFKTAKENHQNIQILVELFITLMKREGTTIGSDDLEWLCEDEANKDILGGITQDDEDREEKALKARERYTGLLILVGELFLKGLLGYTILNKLIVSLLEKDTPTDHKVIYLCTFMSKISPKKNKKGLEFEQHMSNIDNLVQCSSLEGKTKYDYKVLQDSLSIQVEEEEQVKKMSPEEQFSEERKRYLQTNYPIDSRIKAKYTERSKSWSDCLIVGHNIIRGKCHLLVRFDGYSDLVDIPAERNRVSYENNLKSSRKPLRNTNSFQQQPVVFGGGDTGSSSSTFERNSNAFRTKPLVIGGDDIDPNGESHLQGQSNTFVVAPSTSVSAQNQSVFSTFNSNYCGQQAKGFNRPTRPQKSPQNSFEQPGTFNGASSKPRKNKQKPTRQQQRTLNGGHGHFPKPPTGGNQNSFGHQVVFNGDAGSFPRPPPVGHQNGFEQHGVSNEDGNFQTHPSVGHHNTFR